MYGVPHFPYKIQRPLLLELRIQKGILAYAIWHDRMK